jgi:hypothetical protein
MISDLISACLPAGRLKACGNDVLFMNWELRSVMKKYIYGAVLVAIVTAVALFFFRMPETVPPVAPTVLAITFRFPAGYECTEGAPFVLTWRAEDSKGVLSVPVADKSFNPLISPYRLVFTPAPGSKAVVLNARLYYCHKASRMCFQDDFQKRISLAPDAVPVIPVEWSIEPKKTGN